MTTTYAAELPADAIAVLNGRHEAATISESLHVAYWMYSRDKDTALFHLQAAHDKLAELAAQMGYTLTRHEPELRFYADNIMTADGAVAADEVAA